MQGTSLGLRERRARRHRERRWRVIRWLLSLAAIVAAGFYSYETGRRLAEREVVRLQEEIVALNEAIETIEKEKAGLAGGAKAADKRAQDWEQRYRREVPTGPARQLYDLAQTKLDEGVDAARLRFVLSQAREQKVCDEEVQTKRFFVKTPLYRGANDSVGFDRNRITITARGAATVNEAGSPLAQFDPAEPVVARFAQLGGATSETSGTLPIHHSVVIGDSEFRFSLIA